VFVNTFLTQSHEAAEETKRVCPQITQISQIEGSWNLRPSAKSADEFPSLSFPAFARTGCVRNH